MDWSVFVLSQLNGLEPVINCFCKHCCCHSPAAARDEHQVNQGAREQEEEEFHLSKTHSDFDNIHEFTSSCSLHGHTVDNIVCSFPELGIDVLWQINVEYWIISFKWGFMSIKYQQRVNKKGDLKHQWRHRDYWNQSTNGHQVQRLKREVKVKLASDATNEYLLIFFFLVQPADWMSHHTLYSQISCCCGCRLRPRVWKSSELFIVSCLQVAALRRKLSQGTFQIQSKARTLDRSGGASETGSHTGALELESSLRNQQTHK